MKKTDYIRYGLIIIFVTGILGYLISNSSSLISDSYNNITIDQLVEMMNKKDFILINVHVPYEGELPKTDFLIPFNVIEKFENISSNGKDAKIVLYCMSGEMSRIAAEKLTSMGYTRVHNFQNGMRAWRRDGRQILYRSN